MAKFFAIISAKEVAAGILPFPHVAGFFDDQDDNDVVEYWRAEAHEAMDANYQPKPNYRAEVWVAQLTTKEAQNLTDKNIGEYLHRFYHLQETEAGVVRTQQTAEFKLVKP